MVFLFQAELPLDALPPPGTFHKGGPMDFFPYYGMSPMRFSSSLNVMIPHDS